MIRTASVAIVMILVAAKLSFSQDREHQVKRIVKAGGYDFLLTYDSTDFFKGSLIVTDEKGLIAFSSEDFYSSCYLDTLVDLDADGNDEFILGLFTGMSPYVWSSLLVFEFKTAVSQPFEVINGELVSSVSGKSYIKAAVRLSPSYLGALYSYLIEMRNGKLIVPNPRNDFSSSELLGDNSSWIEESISGFENEVDECNAESGYLTLFEAYMIQAKFAGNEIFSREFFRKRYKCDDLTAAYELALKFVDDTFQYTVSQDFRYMSE
jgi:hypothetical protein